MGKCRYDLTTDCNNKDCVKCVLDKIRAEIASYGTNSGMLLALEIIDKYKIERR